MISTRKLVDSDAEQNVLEELLEASKPPLPPSGKSRRLHFLLTTPFRYPPLPNGSRFGTRSERGFFYAGEDVDTALAEVAYYRLVFVEGTAADLGSLTFHWSLFQTQVEAARGVDLTRPPFSKYRERISSKGDYRDSQALGREMRDDGVQACRYFSARTIAPKANVVVFDPAAFGRRMPIREERWYCTLSSESVEFKRDDLLRTRTVTFPRAQFLVDGRLPRPAG